MAIDKRTAATVQTECLAALQAIAAKHGYTVKQHGGTLADISMVLKFEFKSADTNVVQEAEKKTFTQYCELYDLKPEDYRAVFSANGETYHLVGIDLKRRKFPIIAESMRTGKRTLFTDLIVDRIKKARPAA